ncbi:hypothetical protein H312_01654 [Anncaliia algerae PRA339]|uniref:Uncharacterized protein n=1 Tax=Anncaliia algerae PRA339 TaxID=1288291 RepID=A0A059F1T2_9MICR|nr:hypothetical protein H312_01654 [Anncaliia algerae PRA339]
MKRFYCFIVSLTILIVVLISFYFDNLSSKKNNRNNDDNNNMVNDTIEDVLNEELIKKQLKKDKKNLKSDAEINIDHTFENNIYYSLPNKLIDKNVLNNNVNILKDCKNIINGKKITIDNTLDHLKENTSNSSGNNDKIYSLKNFHETKIEEKSDKVTYSSEENALYEESDNTNLIYDMLENSKKINNDELQKLNNIRDKITDSFDKECKNDDYLLTYELIHKEIDDLDFNCLETLFIDFNVFLAVNYYEIECSFDKIMNKTEKELKEVLLNNFDSAIEYYKCPINETYNIFYKNLDITINKFLNIKEIKNSSKFIDELYSATKFHLNENGELNHFIFNLIDEAILKKRIILFSLQKYVKEKILKIKKI